MTAAAILLLSAKLLAIGGVAAAKVRMALRHRRSTVP
jgi:hypothetical protein